MTSDRWRGCVQSSLQKISRISSPHPLTLPPSLPPSLPPGYIYDLLDIARHVASLLLATVPLLLVIIQNARASEGAEVTVREGGREGGRERMRRQTKDEKSAC